MKYINKEPEGHSYHIFMQKSQCLTGDILAIFTVILDERAPDDPPVGAQLGLLWSSNVNHYLITVIGRRG